MDTTKSELYTPSDKKTPRLTPSGEDGMVAFRAKLTPEELAALALLKETEPALCGTWNDAFLMRFIWARKLDVPRAVELLRNHLEWRAKYGLDTAFDAKGVAAYLRHPATYWTPGNYTKQGHSVSYLLARNIDQEMLSGLGINVVMQAHYASLDIALDHDIETGRSGGVFVQDVSGTSFSELMALVKGNGAWDFPKITHATQNTLPFRVSGFLLVNAPWWMRAVLAVVKPLLKPKMRKRIHICNSPDDFLTHFTPEQLATMYGGKFELHSNWVDEVFLKRGELSDGKYVDTAPRTEALDAQIKGDTSKSSEKDAQDKKTKKNELEAIMDANEEAEFLAN